MSLGYIYVSIYKKKELVILSDCVQLLRINYFLMLCHLLYICTPIVRLKEYYIKN